ncbi:MAG: hypothetical protein II290_09685 [Oscillospiraceae bacterium]|nr:hypothetical protein [Oscillospiraceae bacterium]
MEFLIGFFLFYIVFWLAILGLCILQYVLQGYGLYTMARRRGIRNPWLAWIPLGSSWVLGCISDQYQYVTKGVRRNKRKLLVGLSVAVMILPVLFVFFMLVAMLLTESLGGWSVLLVLLGYFGWFALLSGLGIWCSILSYLALYDLYQSAEPKNAVPFLLLSIFCGGIAQAVVLFLCRDKDDGMPPRPVAPVLPGTDGL